MELPLRLTTVSFPVYSRIAFNMDKMLSSIVVFFGWEENYWSTNAALWL